MTSESRSSDLKSLRQNLQNPERKSKNNVKKSVEEETTHKSKRLELHVLLNDVLETSSEESREVTENNFGIAKVNGRKDQNYYVGKVDSADDKDYEATFFKKQCYDGKK